MSQFGTNVTLGLGHFHAYSRSKGIFAERPDRTVITIDTARTRKCSDETRLVVTKR